MEIQINEKTKVEIQEPVKIAGRRSFTISIQVFRFNESGVWMSQAPEIRTIDFPLAVYNEFLALTVKQRYKRALEFLFQDIDREYFRTEEEKIVDYINKVSTDADLKLKLMLLLNEAITAKA